MEHEVYVSENAAEKAVEILTQAGFLREVPEDGLDG